MSRYVKKLKAQAALDLLEQILLTPGDSQNADNTNIPLLVSLDTEAGRAQVYELGISTLDPACVFVSHQQEPRPLNAAIVTHCYKKGGDQHKFRRKAYRFGEAQKLRHKDLDRILRSHLTPTSNNGSPRDIVLIGQSIETDIESIKRIAGLDISKDIPNVRAIIDTQDVSCHTLRLKTPRSLKYLLITLDLDYVGLHNAAHDSRYTLRLLLMLFYQHRWSDKATSSECDSEQQQQRLLHLERIARHHRTRERITWCEPKRVKMTGDPSLFDQEVGDNDGGGEHDIEDAEGGSCGFLTVLF